jgi:hypothetical protein
MSFRAALRVPQPDPRPGRHRRHIPAVDQSPQFGFLPRSQFHRAEVFHRHSSNGNRITRNYAPRITFFINRPSPKPW